MRTVFQFSILCRMNLVTMGSLIQELQDIQIFQICHYIFSEHLVLRISPTFERCCHQLMDSSYIQILQIHKFDSDETIQDPSEHCILCILKLYWIKLNLLLFWGLWLRCSEIYPVFIDQNKYKIENSSLCRFILCLLNAWEKNLSLKLHSSCSKISVTILFVQKNKNNFLEI